MRLHMHTILTGTTVVLVFFKREHVPLYYQFLNNEMKKLTGFCRTSIYDEYKEQNECMNCPRRCVFAILDKETYAKTNDDIASMIGKTKLYFPDERCLCIAETSIRIGNPEFRGKGRGWEAMLLLIHYGITELKARQFHAILFENDKRAVNFFDKLGFKAAQKNRETGEIKMIKDVNPCWIYSVETNLNYVKIPNHEIRILSHLLEQKSIFIQLGKSRYLTPDIEQNMANAEKGVRGISIAPKHETTQTNDFLD